MNSYLTHLKEYSEIIKNIFTALAIIIGGIWALWRFYLYREGASKMEFNLDYRLIGNTGDKYLIELIGIMENKGLVSQRISKWTFDLRLCKEGQSIEDQCECKGFNLQAKLPEIKIHKRKWIHDIENGLTIDAGTVQKFTYLTTIPVNTNFIYIYSSFNYGRKSKDFQTVSKTFLVKESLIK